MSAEGMLILSARGQAWPLDGRVLPEELGGEIEALRFTAGELWCGCQEGAAVAFVPKTYLRRAHFRWLPGGHAPWCISSDGVSRFLTGVQGSLDVFSASLLSECTEDAVKREGRLAAFNLLMRAVFDRAYTASYLAGVRSGQLGSTYCDLVAQVERQMQIQRFSEGLSLASGFATHGLSLRVGILRDAWFITTHDFASGTERYPIFLAGCGRDRREGALSDVTDDVLRTAMRRFQIFRSIVPGPYLALAGVEIQTGLVRRLHLVPIVKSGELVAPIESGPERMEMVADWDQGRAIFKPHSLRALNGLPEKFRQTDGMPSVTLAFRPDGFFREGGTLFVKEVVGMLGLPHYRWLIARKRAYYGDLEAQGLLRYLETIPNDTVASRFSLAFITPVTGIRDLRLGGNLVR